MVYSLHLFFLVLCCILPVQLDKKYDVFVIPIAKTPVVINNVIEVPLLRKSKKSRNDNYIRIDIENYEEPTDVPDLDNFDYLKDRDGTMREEDGNIKGGGSYMREEDRKIKGDRGYMREENGNIKGDLGYMREEDVNIKGDGGYMREEDGNIKGDGGYMREEDGNIKGDGGYMREEDGSIKGDGGYMREEDNLEMDLNYGDDKIVGGREVDINLYPYHVAYGTNCGGAIIDSKWIVTAGHCGKKPYIKVGSKYLNQGTKVNIKRSIIHPNWTAKNKEHPFDFDFQLLETAENLKFNENIQPIKIAHIEDMVIGKVISVTGWGNTEENGPYSSVLRAVRVPIISKENCQSVPFPYFRGSLTARMFCAGFLEGKKDACQGDSGGPAVSSDRLLGMVSFGYGCATPGSYGVYSKVAKVRSWIEQVTGLKLN